MQVLRDLHSATEAMGEYTPKQNAIKSKSLGEKIALIEQLNADIADKEETLASKRKERQLLVYGQFEKDGQDGIIRLTRQIIRYVDGLGDEYEARLERLKKLLEKMAPARTRRKPKDEKDKTRSISEQSFSSIEKNARDAHSTIADIADYAPADPNIDKDKFYDKIQYLRTLNNEIADIINKEISQLVKKRQYEYNSKTAGIRRILTEVKKYVSGSYGTNSDEYNKIRLLKI